MKYIEDYVVRQLSPASHSFSVIFIHPEVWIVVILTSWLLM